MQWAVIENGCGVSFGDDGNILKLDDETSS